MQASPRIERLARGPAKQAVIGAASGVFGSGAKNARPVASYTELYSPKWGLQDVCKQGRVVFSSGYHAAPAKGNAGRCVFCEDAVLVGPPDIIHVIGKPAWDMSCISKCRCLSLRTHHYQRPLRHAQKILIS